MIPFHASVAKMPVCAGQVVTYFSQLSFPHDRLFPNLRGAELSDGNGESIVRGTAADPRSDVVRQQEFSEEVMSPKLPGWVMLDDRHFPT